MNVSSTCPHFSQCSGCTLSENFFHPPVRSEVELFFSKHQAHLAFESDGFEKTRYKAKLAIRGATDCPKIGLFKKNSHEVLAIPKCLVHHPSINLAVERLIKVITSLAIQPYSENPRRGLLRYAQFFVERKSNRVQLVLVANIASMNEEMQKLCEALSADPLWHSIWVNFQPASTNRIFGDEWILVHGESWLWQKIGAREIAFHPGAFSQVHLSLFDRLIETIQDWVEPHFHILELFAGTGAIGLSLLDRCFRVDFIENNPLSALSFTESVKRLPSSLQTRYSYRIENAALLDSPYDLILVDPPRKGLGKALIQDLNHSKNSRLIYVSCHFASFQSDAEALIAKGWKLEKGKGFFLFPGTNEIEICAYFKK